jgi:uncharacterized iron-regulated membrane protein
MRIVHRILSVIACLVLLYLGVTGSLIQILDLKEILGGAPESSVGMQSINEGKNGHPDYAVLTSGDYTAAPLPAYFDVLKGLGIALRGLHEQRPDSQPTFVEMRSSDGATIGQAHFGQSAFDPNHDEEGLVAVDATTGAVVHPVSVPPPIPPHSFRETLKKWHRFWVHHDVPGVYAELLAGIALWSLLVTGLIMYFRLLRQRRRIGRKQLFWMAGGRLRGYHRAVSVIAALLLIVVAFSGTWLGFESSWHTFVSPPPHIRTPELSDAEILGMAGATLQALRATEPSVRIKVLRVREYGGMKQGVVVTDEPVTRQLVFNTVEGKEVSLTELGYPTSGFPFGLQMHEDIKHLHSGFLFGLWARVLDLLAGLSLIFLCVSGLVMYLDMWNKRRSGGRGQFFWR